MMDNEGKRINFVEECEELQILVRQICSRLNLKKAAKRLTTIVYPLSHSIF